MQTQVAIDALTIALKQVPSDSAEFKNKAKIICSFACRTSEEVLVRVGFGAEDTDAKYNTQIAVLADRPDDGPPDMLDIETLQLQSVPTSLATTTETPKTAHEFVFCKSRVVEWDSQRNHVFRVLTYEETARFTIFWLAEKILQIVRKNNWDRVAQLPDLYDRLASFFSNS